MSKHLTSLVVLAILIGTQHSSAQNTSPYWSLAGNSNASSTTSKLGTTNAIPLRLFTNNAVRVYIHPTSGNVGIGTTAPAQKLHVAGNTYITGSMGIGTNTLSGYKLNVLASGSTGGIYVNNSGTGNGIYANNTNGGTGIYGSSTYLGVVGNGNNYGVYGISSSYAIYGSGGTYGVYGSGSTGVYGSGNNGVVGSGTTYGVYGTSTNSYGVYGISSNSLGGYFISSSYYGLRARTDRADKNWAGVFDGNVYAFGVYQTSDKNLKTNIEELGDALSVIEQLKPKSYDFRHDGKLSNLNLPQGKHYGILAQDLEEVLPNLVMEVENEISKPIQAASNAGLSSSPGTQTPAPPIPQRETAEKITTKAVNYTELIPITVKAIQEQQKVIEQQKHELVALKNELAELKQAISMLSNGQNINTSLTSAQLGEVSPNPVKGSANIQYSVPEGMSNVHLLITDALGRSVRQVPINTSGSGIINIDASSLANGVYNCSLIVNYKIISTRKMNVVK
ncbi:tail fiber domain-containing protein [Chitinophagaceae bacterium LB-8]|uniref:Tail fiber domain-containing protein n=1 Tax=Paraflavisolibacter caeni TaxID=2982496 RepID=A0A9X3B8L4_9BACT|nr:tail fiber domain-containing protein [Paraflavisolibacter caeni]MCU7549936.1 tail fiber domain-containing protein [Paraflavisolibacter caeni]